MAAAQPDAAAEAPDAAASLLAQALSVMASDDLLRQRDDMSKRVSMDYSMSVEEVHFEQFLAYEVSTMLVLVAVSLGVGDMLHIKHIHWLPESGATILVGFLFGGVSHFLQPA